ncbi:PREDICTED: uncharacterized protein LOC104815943 [Tarenaya hassleriana]|uniref:uncharacterized protein LOC104815943 n=1 Tax=Tarenaya hassleriana TaxID=28532 RepID=UPI00053C7379|nr:PREDICTED: uncharacterized protein LOC104815943 [Tarenaya hassleriana]
MAASVETPSPHLPKEKGASFMATTTTTTACASVSSPLLSPSSDKRLWSNLRNRIDVLLEERSTEIPNANLSNAGEPERAKRLKEDSMLLLKGFDSVSHTLSQLSNNLENALQGVRELAKPPTLTEILHSNLKEEQIRGEEVEEGNSKGQKRKHEADVDQREDSSNEEERPKENKVMKKAKNVAISMAAKAASLARELKSIKSDLCFMQERCGLLEEENRRLRDGFVKGVRPEEDDLVRLQLEALLAEKSRLANENANLARENQCLQKLVEYHQITSQDLSASYEQVIQSLGLDFPSPVPEIDGEEEDVQTSSGSPKTSIFDVSKTLDEFFEEEQ